MTKEEITELAREAGCTILNVPGVGHIARYNDTRVTNLLERFANLVAAKERERVAKMVDVYDSTTEWAKPLSEAIRRLK